jgi:hypothetical protein
MSIKGAKSLANVSDSELNFWKSSYQKIKKETLNLKLGMISLSFHSIGVYEQRVGNRTLLQLLQMQI